MKLFPPTCSNWLHIYWMVPVVLFSAQRQVNCLDRYGRTPLDLAKATACWWSDKIWVSQIFRCNTRENMETYKWDVETYIIMYIYILYIYTFIYRDHRGTYKGGETESIWFFDRWRTVCSWSCWSRTAHFFRPAALLRFWFRDLTWKPRASLQ